MDENHYQSPEAEEAKLLTVADLLADLVRFNGQTVAVLGFFVGEREHVAIHSSRIGYKYSSQASIWLYGIPVKKAALARMNRGWVKLAGVFHDCRRGGIGHFGAYPACISRITEFEAAEPPPDKAAPSA